MSDDTGPPQPPGPAPGSNAMDYFAAGLSPVGDIPTFDFWKTVISQYANSPRLIAMISNFFDNVDQTANMASFFDLMWNVLTAEGYGLDCWGTIVAVNRVLHLPDGTKFLGWDEGGTLDYDPFNQSPWYSGVRINNNFVLTDDGFRVLILAKALSNICDGGIPTINRILTLLFAQSGKCYCTDEGGMAMTYTFEFVPTPPQLAIVSSSGVLPTPTGVSFTIVQP